MAIMLHKHVTSSSMLVSDQCMKSSFAKTKSQTNYVSAQCYVVVKTNCK